MMNRMLYTPPVTKNLLIVNCLFFAAYYVLAMRGIDLNDLLGLHFFLAPDFAPWQLLTYMFMHASLQHIFFNMFALWMFGRVLEQTWGGRRYLTFYLLCGLGAGVCQELWQLGEYLLLDLPEYNTVNLSGQVVPMGTFLNSWTTVGASGAIYGVLLGFGMSYPDERILIFPIPVPIKAKYFVIGYAAIEIFSAFAVSDNTAHFAHLGGMLVGWLLIRHYRGGLRGGRRSWRLWWQRLAGRLRRPERPQPPHHDGRAPHAGADAAEIDRILEKVRRSGYSSLTDEEKQKLFDRNR